MEKKDKRRVIICLIIAIIIIIFTIYNNNPNNKIKHYIKNREFKLEQDEVLYYKQISNNTIDKYNQDKEKGIKTNYDYLYFDIYNYKLSEIINEYEDNYESSININYKFKTDTINYIYRINYNKTNIIFKGKYINAFAQKLLMSPYFLSTVNMLTYGVKMPRLGTNEAKQILLPLPPLEEQQRIVERIEQIFEQLDILEKSLGE